MIRVEGLSKRYRDVSVLSSLSFEVRAGQRVAVLGMNGAGKTTLFRTMLGLTDFTGRIRVDGLDVEKEGLRTRARLGYVPQRPPVSGTPLGDFVALFAGLRGTPAERVTTMLRTLGLSLETDGGKPLSALSGGMLQKALLALALASEVPVLLLDEPTANLDPLAREEFLGALGRIDTSTTLLLASHRLSEVEAVCDHVIVLHQGALAFDGTLDELWRRTGGAGNLWVELPPGERDAALRLLETRGTRSVRPNGRGVWIEVEPSERGRVVSDLGAAGLSPGDLRTVDEPFTQVLARLSQGKQR